MAPRFPHSFERGAIFLLAGRGPASRAAWPASKKISEILCASEVFMLWLEIAAILSGGQTYAVSARLFCSREEQKHALSLLER